MPAEQVLQDSAFAQPGDHLVEAGLEQPDLTAVINRDVRVELAALHAGDGPS